MAGGLAALGVCEADARVGLEALEDARRAAERAQVVERLGVDEVVQGRGRQVAREGRHLVGRGVDDLVRLGGLLGAAREDATHPSGLLDGRVLDTRVGRVLDVAVARELEGLARLVEAGHEVARRPCGARALGEVRVARVGRAGVGDGRGERGGVRGAAVGRVAVAGVGGLDGSAFAIRLRARGGGRVSTGCSNRLGEVLVAQASASGGRSRLERPPRPSERPHDAQGTAYRGRRARGARRAAGEGVGEARGALHLCGGHAAALGRVRQGRGREEGGREERGGGRGPRGAREGAGMCSHRRCRAGSST